ncbi:MAG: phosphatidate cytidylyltransferase [Sodaliphilus sp.]
MKNFITRIISGAVYVGCICCAVCFFDTIPAIYLLFFSLITLLAVRECERLTSGNNPQAKVVSTIDSVGAVAIFISIYFLGKYEMMQWMYLPLIIYGLLRFIIQLYIKNQNAIASEQVSMFNLLYVVLPLSLMSQICFMEHHMLLLSIFIFLWVNDSGAYLVGSTIGKYRLFERISPKKSWEGFWGGLLLTVAAGYVMVAYFNSIFHGPSPLQFAGLGLVVSVAGTLGDLAESLMKRTANVKDSSNLIPGHGGILDRIDSLLFAVPAAIIYLIIIHYFS